MDIETPRNIQEATLAVPFSTAFTKENISRVVNETYNNDSCKWTNLNTVLTCLLFLTFVLNVLSSIVLFRVPLVTVRGRSNPVYLCIRFLNICDVLQALFLILMPAFASPECNWLGGKISCSIMGFIVLFFLLVSPLITILMAFDRVVALYIPFKYRSHLGLKMLKFLLPSACVLVFITTILPIFGIGEYHVVKGRRFCLLDTITDNAVDRSYVLGVHAVFLIALLFMLSCTIAFQSKLLTMSFTKKHKESKSKTRKKRSSKRTRNATLTTMAVCCIFIVCYLPYVIRVLVEATTLQKSPGWITWVTFGLAFLQPLLNPLVYIGTNSRYRKELQAIVNDIKVSDWDTSSDSGTTQGALRAGLNEFRRRISSGGSRGGKRGSKRGQENHSLPDFLHGKPTKRGSWKRKSGCNTFHSEHIQMKTTVVKNKDCHSPDLQHLQGDDKQRCREPSSSSGVRSYDSVEKMPLTPPTVSSPCTRFSQSSAFLESTKYGRGLGDNDDVFEPERRARCDSASIQTNQKREHSKLIDSQSASTPSLLNENDSHVTKSEFRYSGSDVTIKSKLPEVIISSNVHDRLPCDESTRTYVENARLKRINGSYKKAVETKSQCYPVKKPFKRDSGVGES